LIIQRISCLIARPWRC